MPIKGMTDKATPSFPQIGTIRKGGPKGKNRPGPDLKHFRVEFQPGEEEAAARFTEVYGSTPRDIAIVLPFDEVDRCWVAWREAYLASALIHRCDGETVEYAISPETGELLVKGGVSVETGEVVHCDGTKPVAHYSSRNNRKVPIFCKPQGRLRVILPVLERAAYLLLLTGSVHDIISISGQLEGIKALNAGVLQGVPLVLRRRPRRISTPGQGGKRVRREKWLCSVEADPRWVRLKLDALEASVRPDAALLTEGGDQVIEDEEGVEDEVVEGEVLGMDPGSINDSMWDARWVFLEDVVIDLDYFSHPAHVENAMAKLGLEYVEGQEKALYAALEIHATKRKEEKAEEKAAAKPKAATQSASKQAAMAL